ncbi:unnamed protein product [Trichogramma brassicae]|uniref:Retrotransposon gag domain-containing protein n=1 Tax=Trichogramma brassicae TaxID=86971 RepID=A0A6H5IIP7_9HYME|nr:unnamed protein product [Trichogramma brassicae]
MEKEMEKHAIGILTSTKIARPSLENMMNNQAEKITSWVDPRKVQVNDTFDIRYFQPSLESTTHEPSMNDNKNRIRPEEESALLNGRTWNTRQNNPTPNSVLTDRPSIFTSTDLGKTMRSWNFKFNGSTEMNVEEFLRRVKECTQSARLSEMDVLGSMPELLSGIALRWYRNNKNKCQTWAQFCTEARRYFGVTQYFQERLQAEVVTRTQGSQEPVAEYIICAQALMNQLEGKWPPQQQLELLYQNMRPELRKVIPRDQVTSIARLVDLARTQERILKDEQTFREPPPPEEVFGANSRAKRRKKIIKPRKITSQLRQWPPNPVRRSTQPRSWRAERPKSSDNSTSQDELDSRIKNERNRALHCRFVRLHDCVLRANWFVIFYAMVDPRTHELYFDNIKVCQVEFDNRANKPPSISSVGLQDSTAEERAELEEIMARTLPDLGPDAPLGCTDWAEHEIEVTCEKPIKQRCYPVSQRMEEIMYEQLENMLKQGIVTPSTSSWSSPIVMVKKANGQYRFCIDYRKLNAATKVSARPMPHMDTPNKVGSVVYELVDDQGESVGQSHVRYLRLLVQPIEETEEAESEYEMQATSSEAQTHDVSDEHADANEKEANEAEMHDAMGEQANNKEISEVSDEAQMHEPALEQIELHEASGNEAQARNTKAEAIEPSSEEGNIKLDKTQKVKKAKRKNTLIVERTDSRNIGRKKPIPPRNSKRSTDEKHTNSLEEQGPTDAAENENQTPRRTTRATARRKEELRATNAKASGGAASAQSQ